MVRPRRRHPGLAKVPPLRLPHPRLRNLQKGAPASGLIKVEVLRAHLKMPRRPP